MELGTWQMDQRNFKLASESGEKCKESQENYCGKKWGTERNEKDNEYNKNNIFLEM